MTTDTYEDADQRLGGHDDPVLLEQLHEQAENVKPDKGLTRYEVHARTEGTTWQVMGVVVAGGAREAIRQYVVVDAPDDLPQGSTLRAIPVRNITQVVLSMETTTRLRLS